MLDFFFSFITDQSTLALPPGFFRTKNTLLLEPLWSSCALPGSAGLEGNSYRLQQQSPSHSSHVTPLFPGKNAMEHFSWIDRFSKCIKSVLRQKEEDAKKWIWPIHIWPCGAHFSGMQTLGAFMWMEDLKGEKKKPQPTTTIKQQLKKSKARKDGPMLVQ